MVLIAKLKLHPFLALVLGSAFVGLASGVELAKVITNFEDGVGGVLKEVGLLIALGADAGQAAGRLRRGQPGGGHPAGQGQRQQAWSGPSRSWP